MALRAREAKLDMAPSQGFINKLHPHGVHILSDHIQLHGFIRVSGMFRTIEGGDRGQGSLIDLTIADFNSLPTAEEVLATLTASMPKPETTDNGDGIFTHTFKGG